MINGETILRNIYNNLNENQYQPAGIDLTLDSIQELIDNNLHLYGLFEDIKILPQQKKVDTTTVQVKGSLRKVYTLEPHKPYIATTKEKINIDNHSAQFYLPRSSLLRAGVDVRTALGDPGFNGHLNYSSLIPLLQARRPEDGCSVHGSCLHPTRGQYPDGTLPAYP